MRYIMLLVLLLVFCAVAHAQIYKWVDQDGNIQYTDQPPSAGSAQKERKLKIKSTPASPADNKSTVPKSLAEERAEFDKRRLDKHEAESKRQAEIEVNNQKCMHAQGKLKTFRDSARLTMPDGKGGIQYVDDDLRQKNIEEAKKNISTFCK